MSDLSFLIPVVWGAGFATLAVLFVVKLIQSTRQRRVLKYTDALRATELVGRVRQLKVRGREEEAVRLVHDELAMPLKVARSWVKSI